MNRSQLPPRYRQKPPLTLRTLQVEMFNEVMLGLMQAHQRLTIVAPPGAGKTATSLTIIGHLLVKGVKQFDDKQRDFLGAVILTPTLQILHGFSVHDELEVPAGIWKQRHQSYLVDLKSFWAQESVEESATKEEIAAFFKNKEGGVIAMTYQMLHTHWASFPKDLSKYVLLLDEAHHAPLNKETRLAERRDDWQKHGGVVLQTTATPWHTESGQRIYEEGDPGAFISLRDLRGSNLVPEEFEINRVMLPYVAKTLKALLLQDGEPSLELLEAYKTIAKFWVKQKKPITIIRPPDRKHVRALQRVFEEVGARVLDATGKFDKSKLFKERTALLYKDLEYDVIIACRRFDEGTDHKMVSNVYYIGAPYSTRHVVQLFGRTFRLKVKIVPDYPEEWVNKASFTTFVPKGTAAVAEKYFEVHQEDAILLASYIGDIEVGNFAISNFASRLRESFVFGVKRDDGKRRTVFRKKIIEAMFGDDFSRPEAVAALQKIIFKVSRERDEPETKVDAEAVMEEVLNIGDPALRSRVVGVCVDEWRNNGSESMQQAADALEAFYEKQIADVGDGVFDEEIHRAVLPLGDAIREIVKQFTHLHTMSINKGLITLLTKFTGADADTITTKLRRLAMSNPTRGEVVRAISSYINVERRYPTAKSGRCDHYGLPGYTFAQLAAKWSLFGLSTETLEEYGRFRMGVSGRKRTRR